VSRARAERPPGRADEVGPATSSLTPGQLVALLAIPVIVSLVLLLLG